MRLGILLVPLLIALAGCVDGGKDLKVNTITLDFEGSESGDHEKSGECDTDGRFTGNGDLEDGQVRVTVRDADGEQVFERTYQQDFTVDSTELTGAAGQWTLRAERTSDAVLSGEFRGRYTFTLTC